MDYEERPNNMGCVIRVSGEASKQVKADKYVIGIRINGYANKLDSLVQAYNELFSLIKTNIQNLDPEAKIEGSGIKVISSVEQIEKIFNLLRDKDKTYITSNITVRCQFNEKIFGILVKLLDTFGDIQKKENSKSRVYMESSIQCRFDYSKDLVNSTRKELIATAYLDALSKARAIIMKMASTDDVFISAPKNFKVSVVNIAQPRSYTIRGANISYDTLECSAAPLGDYKIEQGDIEERQISTEVEVELIEDKQN